MENLERHVFFLFSESYIDFIEEIMFNPSILRGLTQKSFHRLRD